MPVTTLAIISDTHMPSRGRTLPEVCVDRLRAADLIIHAGDLIAPEVLEQLRGYGEVAAVHGNIDTAQTQSLLPARLELKIDQLPLGVVHDGGPAAGRLERLQRRFPEARAVVFGHSHVPLIERNATTGFQIFNPGSPTDKRKQPKHTMGWAEVKGAEISFQLVELD